MGRKIEGPRRGGPFSLVGTLRRRAAELMGKRGEMIVLAKIVGMSKMNQVRTVKRELR